MAETQAPTQDQAPTHITIDGVNYLISDLTDEAKAQIQSLRFVEAELARLNAQIAIASTAKMAYQGALKTALPEQTPA